MKNPALYPLTFREILKPYVWGGRGLEKLGKDLGDFEIVAESWEIADHGEVSGEGGSAPSDPVRKDPEVSVVKNGPLAGRNLRDLVHTYGEDICPNTPNGRFPIIVKFIDARERLSVQVHPDDEYAGAHEPPGERGKTESWYVMDAPEDGELVMGLARGTTRERFAGLLRAGRIEEGLNRIRIEPGDAFFIRPGTVHALFEGTLVCEVLENSDTTYRLHDWGRLGNDGKPRPLHTRKALDVMNFPSESGHDEYMRSIVISYDRSARNEEIRLVRCPHFNIDYLRLDRNRRLAVGDSHFHCLTVLNGEGALVWGGLSGGWRKSGSPLGEALRLRRGETVLVPRPVSRYSIMTGGMEVLKTFL